MWYCLLCSPRIVVSDAALFCWFGIFVVSVNLTVVGFFCAVYYPGVHLRLTSEAAFESLDEFVEAHLIAPLALPCRLILPRSDWIDEANDETGGRSKTSKIPSSPGWKSKFSAAASDGWHRSSSQHVKSPTAMRTRPVKTSMSVAEKLETKSDDPGTCIFLAFSSLSLFLLLLCVMLLYSYSIFYCMTYWLPGDLLAGWLAG